MIRFRPLAAGLCALFLSGSALADLSDKAAADAAFEAARELSTKGRHEEACPKYAESHRLDPALGTLMYLAECTEKVERLATAWGHWRSAAEWAARTRHAERERVARAHVAARGPRRAPLLVRIADRTPGLEVRRDGAPVSSLEWGVPTPIDRGRHRLEASEPGGRTFARDVDVKDEGATYDVEIHFAPPPAASSPPPVASSAPPPPLVVASAPPSSPPPAPPAQRPSRVIPYAVLGTGVALVAVGAYLGLKAISTNHDADAFCNAARECDGQGLDKISTAKSYATASTITTALGIVGAGVGAWLVLSTPAADVGVAASPGTLGVAARGAF